MTWKEKKKQVLSKSVSNSGRLYRGTKKDIKKNIYNNVGQIKSYYCLFNPIPAYSSQLLPVPAHSSLFQIIQAISSNYSMILWFHNFTVSYFHNFSISLFHHFTTSVFQFISKPAYQLLTRGNKLHVPRVIPYYYHY